MTATLKIANTHVVLKKVEAYGYCKERKEFKLFTVSGKTYVKTEVSPKKAERIIEAIDLLLATHT